MVAGSDTDDSSGCGISTDVVINAGSIAGKVLAMEGSWGGVDSAAEDMCTGATQAFGTSMTAEGAWKGMTLGTEAADCEAVGTKGECNGMATAMAGANDNVASADGGQKGGMMPVMITMSI